MNGYATHVKKGELVSIETLANSPALAFDVEGSGFHVGTDRPYGYSITDNSDSAYYASVHDSLFRELLADETKVKFAHNAKYDRAMLAKAGLVIDNLGDPMIAAHLLEYPSLSLQDLTRSVFREEIVSFKQLTKPLEVMTDQELADYSCPHSEMTVALWNALLPELKRLGLLSVFWDIEMPLVPVLSDMEIAGVAVDEDTLDVLGEEFDRKIAIMVVGLDKLSGTPGMNHNSSDQVAHLLYDVFELPVGRATPTGGRPSVDKRYIETIADKHTYIPLYLQYKQIKTLKNSYVDSLKRQLVDGRIYGSFNQTRTRTGRLSSSDPNLQKIPQRTATGRRIRTAFRAPPGKKLIKADYDQLELRGMAHVSQDKALMAAFIAGRDIHTETAILIYRDPAQRFKGKTQNFRLIYGGGSVRERKLLFSAYPEVEAWIHKIGIYLQEVLYARTLGGRIRTIDELSPTAPDRVIQHGVREGISTIVQGSSAEQVKKGMRRAWDVFKHTDVKGVLQVHDEVVYEVPEGQVNDAIEVIQNTFPSDEWSVPLTVSVEVGDNWGEGVKVKKGEKYVNP